MRRGNEARRDSVSHAPVEEQGRWLLANEAPDGKAQFEGLLMELSATFVNLPGDEVDARIEQGLRQIVQFLGIDRSTFAEFAEGGRELRSTHSYVEPGVPPFPQTVVDEQLPWYTGKLRRGDVLRFERLPEDLPAEAAREREYCERSGLKSHVAIPLKAGGAILGVIGFGSFRAYHAWPDRLVQRLGLVGEVFANALARRQAEQALRTSERHYRELLGSTRAVPWESDPTGHQLRFIGPQAVALLGYPLEDWYQDGFRAARIHSDDRERIFRATADAVARGEDVELEYRMVSAGGRDVWVHDLVSVPRAPGHPGTLRGVLIDVTARKSAEEESHALRDQLARVTRAVTMGELAAAIAHEVNQPLCAVISNAQAAQRLMAGGDTDADEVREALRDIVDDGRRASEVVARIRTLFERRPSERVPVDVNEAIRGVAALLQHQLARKGVSPSLDLAPDLPSVVGDRVQLQQVMLNLAINAIDAMTHAVTGPRALSIGSAREGRDGVLVSVHDTGPGISPQDAERVFDAFYTTKAGGMGIGLAISRSIIALHGGRIWVDPGAGRGATFHFTLRAVGTN